MIKNITILSILLSLPIAALASHYVHGYTRSNGTYVQPHLSMDPGESEQSGMSYHYNVLQPRQY